MNPHIARASLAGDVGDHEFCGTRMRRNQTLRASGRQIREDLDRDKEDHWNAASWEWVSSNAALPES